MARSTVPTRLIFVTAASRKPNGMLVGMRALPWLSFFQELNVRTYAFDHGGTPGVWFIPSIATARSPCWARVL